MLEDGKAGDPVEEYVGEGLTTADFAARRARSPDQQQWYFCSLANGVVLDASHMGNYSRFANHSCCPTAAMTPWSVATMRRLLLTLIVDVEAGGEVTWSYGVADGTWEEKCECGATNCTGTIARLPPGEAVSAVPVVPRLSPPAPAAKRGRSEVVEETESDEDPSRAPAEDEAGAARAGPPTPAGDDLPSEDQVKEAMLSVEGQLQASQGTAQVKATWSQLRSWLTSPSREDVARALTSPHADNMRAFLIDRGPPFVLSSPVEFTDPPHSPSPPPHDTSQNDVIDLTDSPPTLDRLDAGVDDRGVSEERGGSHTNACPSEGGKGVGGF
mmetsp:Transcript_70997/g.147948  ORF Transcript_70997/g.147948 Transcript_70997/m.147948 type:complete len:328 (-) Transcript_70997:1352-2335(-)